VVTDKVKDDEDKADEDKDNDNQEDVSMPYLSRETVDGYVVMIIGHLEKCT